MIVASIFVIIGFALLIKGADFLVSGASGIAKKFKISEMIIGLTIVAMGTSMPELVVSFTSALEGHSDIALGNVIGSNLVNILFILGLCVVIKSIHIPKETKWYENPMNLGVTIVLLLVCNNGGTEKAITRPEGFILLFLFAMFLVYVIKMAKNNETIAEELEEEKTDKNNGEVIAENSDLSKTEAETEKVSQKKPLLKNIIKVIVGIIALKFGADFVVDNSIIIAEMFGISEKIIGLTIVAIGTSLPELVASVTAVLKGENDMAIGNVIGSNIFNILLILGISSVISPISYALSYNTDILLLIVTGILLTIFPFLNKKSQMTRIQGVIFATIYIAYIVTLIFVR